MKVKEVIRQIKADGWIEVRQESSHRTFKKKGVAGNVAVAGTDGEDFRRAFSANFADRIALKMKIDVLLGWTGNNWCAYAPDLEDTVFSTGAIREETVSRFRDA